MNLFDLNLTLPISDPTWVFFLVLIIILFAPMILGRLHIPHIIGMILAGLDWRTRLSCTRPRQ
jgi:hypothetical protein